MDWCLRLFGDYPDYVEYIPCWERLRFFKDSELYLDVGAREFETLIDNYLKRHRP